MMFICCHTFIDEAAAAQHVGLELRVADEGKAHSNRAHKRFLLSSLVECKNTHYL